VLLGVESPATVPGLRAFVPGGGPGSSGGEGQPAEQIMGEGDQEHAAENLVHWVRRARSIGEFGEVYTRC
jgi:hypothetical protein